MPISRKFSYMCHGPNTEYLEELVQAFALKSGQAVDQKVSEHFRLTKTLSLDVYVHRSLNEHGHIVGGVPCMAKWLPRNPLPEFHFGLVLGHDFATKVRHGKIDFNCDTFLKDTVPVSSSNITDATGVAQLYGKDVPPFWLDLKDVRCIQIEAPNGTVLFDINARALTMLRDVGRVYALPFDHVNYDKGCKVRITHYPRSCHKDIDLPAKDPVPPQMKVMINRHANAELPLGSLIAKHSVRKVNTPLRENPVLPPKMRHKYNFGMQFYAGPYTPELDVIRGFVVSKETALPQCHALKMFRTVENGNAKVLYSRRNIEQSRRFPYGIHARDLDREAMDYLKSNAIFAFGCILDEQSSAYGIQSDGPLFDDLIELPAFMMPLYLHRKPVELHLDNVESLLIGFNGLTMLNLNATELGWLRSAGITTIPRRAISDKEWDNCCMEVTHTPACAKYNLPPSVFSGSKYLYNIYKELISAATSTGCESTVGIPKCISSEV